MYEKSRNTCGQFKNKNSVFAKKVRNTCKQLPLTAGYWFLKNFMGL